MAKCRSQLTLDDEFQGAASSNAECFGDEEHVSAVHKQTWQCLGHNTRCTIFWNFHTFLIYRFGHAAVTRVSYSQMRRHLATAVTHQVHIH